MAAASEREHLARRVAQLESEVTQLRSALAAVLQAASTGLSHTPPIDAETGNQRADQSH